MRIVPEEGDTLMLVLEGMRYATQCTIETVSETANPKIFRCRIETHPTVVAQKPERKMVDVLLVDWRASQPQAFSAYDVQNR